MTNSNQTNDELAPEISLSEPSIDFIDGEEFRSWSSQEFMNQFDNRIRESQPKSKRLRTKGSVCRPAGPRKPTLKGTRRYEKNLKMKSSSFSKNNCVKRSKYPKDFQETLKDSESRILLPSLLPLNANFDLENESMKDERRQMDLPPLFPFEDSPRETGDNQEMKIITEASVALSGYDFRVIYDSMALLDTTIFTKTKSECKGFVHVPMDVESVDRYISESFHGPIHKISIDDDSTSDKDYEFDYEKNASDDEAFWHEINAKCLGQ